MVLGIFDYLPVINLIITGLIVFIILLIISLRTYVLLNASHTIPKIPKGTRQSKLVSIHLACANEPAEVVIKTLKSLLNLDYPAFEVLVIHNNNSNKNIMSKIQKACNDLSTSQKKFKYYHKAKIAGFKAGALNYVYQFTDPKSEVIAIIDADYLVDPKFLKIGMKYFANPKIGIVQFPQDYNHITDTNSGLALEYKSFFTVLMNTAQKLDGVIFTGTMGLIRAEIFNKQLNWNEWCITEDIEVGFQIHNLGYSGVYVDESMGKGLMPFDYLSLIRQRRRWVYGNMQVLQKNLVPVLQNKTFAWRQKASFYCQLIAWFKFDTILLVLITLNGLLYSIFNLKIYSVILITLFVVLVGLIIYELYYFIVSVPKRQSTKTKAGWKAFLTHRGLSYTMSSSWLIELFGKKLSFDITKKDGFHSTDNNIGMHYEYRLIYYALIAATSLILSDLNWLAMVLVLYTILHIFSVKFLSRSLYKGSMQ